MRTEPELKDSMAFAMGGRAAEEIFYDGVVSTGAHNDLEKATDTARAMVDDARHERGRRTDLARRRRAATVVRRRPKVSQKTAETIDSEVRRLLEEAHEPGPRDPEGASASC